MAPSRLKQALKTFTLIDEPIYAHRSFGKTGVLKPLACDCDPEDVGDDCCGPDSGCLNRQTYMECYGNFCGCGMECGNRDFQLKNNAKIDVFNAGKKGFGVRALEPIKKNHFIAEYVGEVIDEARYIKRKQKYESEAYPHFYFMMLQTREFIDATEKGGIARFCNHSCDPNARIEKWVVGEKLRMGLFAARDIALDEEICFDYKVDRYGSKPQKCLCGSAKCAGILGGSTQTPAFMLPISAIEGLDLEDDEVSEWPDEALAAIQKAEKQSMRKLKLCLLDFGKTPHKGLVPLLNADPDELDKTQSYARDVILSTLPANELESENLGVFLKTLADETEHEWVIMLMLERILNTSDERLHSAIIHMHGYDLLCQILKKWYAYPLIISSVLNILSEWPKVTKNKISSSEIEGEVAKIRDNKDRKYDRKIKNLAADLLEEWKNLAVAYRIPRRKAQERGSGSNSGTTHAAKSGRSAAGSNGRQTSANSRESRAQKRASTAANNSENLPNKRPRSDSGSSSTKSPSVRDRSAILKIARLRKIEKRAAIKAIAQTKANQASRIQQIIADASSAIETKFKPSSPDNQENKSKPKSKSKSKSRGGRAASNVGGNGNEPFIHTPSQLGPEGESALRELLAKYLVKLVYKYESGLGKERCRRHTRDLVNIVIRKEQAKNTNFGKFELTEPRKVRIREFVTDYMNKVVDRQAKIGRTQTSEALSKIIPNSASSDSSI